MKIRKGFVSNSSSSSFVCDICHADESGWDLSIMELPGWFECERGHVICGSHTDFTKYSWTFFDSKEQCLEYLEKNSYLQQFMTDEKEKLMNVTEEQFKDEEFMEELVGPVQDLFPDLLYEVPSSKCPICNFGNITDDILLHYVLRTYASHLGREGLKKEIRNKFKNLKEFNSYYGIE